ncbi:hypothetical protein F2Q69_00006304 [Brassica cretica]|uniref:Uncharacterized protein n=1 Tax=Brassica cretica TaxID=69181 RepID=A0A8S9PD08_BRACR|nr:hypothetical protein F2Q69_00006304 [Brassica cretica]
MGDRSDRRLESSFVGSRVRSRNQIENEPPRSADSSDLSLDLTAEVESPRSAAVAEAEGSPSTVEVVIRVPGPFDRVSDFRVDKVPVYEGFFESGFRDCVPSLVAKVSEFLDISPGQLNPFSWRTLIAIQNLGDLEGLILGVEEILYSYFVCPMHVGESRLYLHSRHRTPYFQEIPKKDRKRHPDFESGWTEKFAFMTLPDVSCLTSSVGRKTIEGVLKLPIKRRHIPFLVSKEVLERCSIWVNMTGSTGEEALPAYKKALEAFSAKKSVPKTTVPGRGDDDDVQFMRSSKRKLAASSTPSSSKKKMKSSGLAPKTSPSSQDDQTKVLTNLNTKLEELREEIFGMKHAEETFDAEKAMVVNGAKVVSRWDQQTDKWNPAVEFEQYKEVKTSEAQLQGLSPPSFDD